ncbi:MAG: DNA methyltransferase [Pseudomonadota bacterium]
MYKRYEDDFAVIPIHERWENTKSGVEKSYVVQTANSVIERCLLMTTDPGDLVLDPTCGSGTTAYIAEQWGRRWITCDTSRVALALARTRLMTAKFPYYKLKDSKQGIKQGFVYKTVPHVTLKNQSEQLQIIVADEGPGIPEAALETVFEHFYRLETSRSRATNASMINR